MVTYCVHWTDSVGAKIQCTDVGSGESAATARTRALRQAKTRMDNGETPLDGTELWMEKLVDSFSSVVADTDVGANWQNSFAEFTLECLEAP